MADPTTADLFKAKTVTDAEIVPAVGAFMAGATDAFRFESGHTLDLAAAVKAHEPSAKAVVDEGASEGFRRGRVRTAILLARPVAP